MNVLPHYLAQARRFSAGLSSLDNVGVAPVRRTNNVAIVTSNLWYPHRFIRPYETPLGDLREGYVLNDFMIKSFMNAGYRVMLASHEERMFPHPKVLHLINNVLHVRVNISVKLDAVHYAELTAVFYPY